MERSSQRRMGAGARALPLLFVLSACASTKVYSPRQPTSAELSCSSGEVPIAQRFYAGSASSGSAALRHVSGSQQPTWQPAPGTTDRRGVAQAKAVCTAPPSATSAAPEPSDWCSWTVANTAKDSREARSTSASEECQASHAACYAEKTKSLLEVEKWLSFCVLSTHGTGPSCGDACKEEWCTKQGESMLEDALFKELDLNKCKASNDLKDFEAWCRPIANYVNGLTVDLTTRTYGAPHLQ